VTLFLSAAEETAYSAAIVEHFRHNLPYEFRGYSTNFEEHADEPGILGFAPITSGPINHRVCVTTLNQQLKDYLKLDWRREMALDVADWLSFPQQILRTLTQGGVYHAALGDVPAMQAQFAWYPHDVWLLLLAAGWARISQEEAFVGRTGDVGDEIGSRIIAARLVRDLMMLCFLMERQYAPYPKWFGTGFARLECSTTLTPLFERVLAATDLESREGPLTTAYQIVGAMHNQLDITEPLATEIVPYFGRPYQVIFGDRFADALIGQIDVEAARHLARTHGFGAIDQFSDSTDFREPPSLRPHIKALYD
jgi:hypothetical protein